jgi:tetratricopeptide (TPR) repeat protein
MKSSESSHTHSHSNAHDCSCHHEHDHGQEHSHDHSHDHQFLSVAKRWILTVALVALLLFLLRPFIISQMLVRVTSYSANASYHDAIRICKKIIAMDAGNIQAWTALGYAYMDISQPQMAIDAFDQVLSLNPDDRGAASYELGQAYFAQGEYARAIGYFERVRAAGPQASTLLEADVLKYRHGTMGFRNLNSMQTLLGDLLECYKQTGNTAKAAEIQKEYDFYKAKHSKILF